MASLGPNATVEELDDELVFQQTLLDSLGDDVPDDDSAKAGILAAIADLESRIQAHQSSASPLQSRTSDDEVLESNDSDDAFSVNAPSPSKRPAAESPQGSDRKRHAATPKTPAAINAATKRAASTVERFLAQKSSALERQRQAEEDARRRRAAEEADALFALQLSQQAESSTTAASRPNTLAIPHFQSASSLARQGSSPGFGGSGASSQRQPSVPLNNATVKPEPVRLQGRPAPVQQTSGFCSGVVDLTGDSDTSQDDRTIPFGRFARTPQGVGHTTTMDRLMEAQNFNLQRERERQRQAQESSRQAELQRQQQQVQRDRNFLASTGMHGDTERVWASTFKRMDEKHKENERQLAESLTLNNASPEQVREAVNKLRQNQQKKRDHLNQQFEEHKRFLATMTARTSTENVYNMPGAYPQQASASQPPSIYEPQSSRESVFSKLGKGLSMVQDDLAQLGSLIGSGGPADYYRSRYDDPFDEGVTDEEVMASLKNLMDNIRPDEEIPIDERDVEVESMTVKLKPYQAAGLKWLQNMEEGSNKGGILADDMGLGKTIQAIALMSTRKSEDPQQKTNLIIAPVALLQQWKEEIRTKLKRGSHALTVFIHHGAAKKKTWDDLRKFDIVITTFGTLASEMRKRDIFLARQRVDPTITERPNERCLIIGERSKWYRVIIDEAQNIKNRSTQSSRAASMIHSKYRLCMTGTPMMNSPEELYSLIRFLKIKPYNDLQRFQLDFSRPLKSAYDGPRREIAMQKLQALLKAILLRRQKTSKINGKPILVLPERIVEQTHPTFTEEERDFYTALETQSRIKFNRFVQAGTVGKSYAHILVMLLRLRQACCHPHLIKDFGVAVAANISQETMDDIAKSLLLPVVERIKASGGEFECPVCYDAVQNPAIFVPCGHDTCADCYVKIKESAQGGEIGDPSAPARCPNCRGSIDPKRVIDYETFKKIHLTVVEEIEEPKAEPGSGSTTEDEAEETDADDETDDETDEDETEDESETESLNGFVVVDEEEIEEDDEDIASAPKEKGKGRAPTRPGALSFSDSDTELLSETDKKALIKQGKQPEQMAGAEDDETESADDVKPPQRRSRTKTKSKKKKSKRQSKGKGKTKADGREKKKKKAPQRTLAELKKLGSKNKSAKKEYLSRVRSEFVPSAKVDKTIELLKQIIEETDEKVIVFSQWTSLLDLLEVPVDEQGWGYQRYDGSMSARDRADAIDAFKSTSRFPQIRLMLVSLKAGNAGLNLTCASQVIILDPFWNPYIEEQAIDRAHRLGQEREVKVHRLLIEDTVEDRILALQEKKRQMINEALDEGAGQRLSRLNQEQLGYLFGVTRGPPPS